MKKYLAAFMFILLVSFENANGSDELIRMSPRCRKFTLIERPLLLSLQSFEDNRHHDGVVFQCVAVSFYSQDYSSINITVEVENELSARLGYITERCNEVILAGGDTAVQIFHEKMEEVLGFIKNNVDCLDE